MGVNLSGFEIGVAEPFADFIKKYALLRASREAKVCLIHANLCIHPFAKYSQT
jgi:hypothetical protein